VQLHDLRLAAHRFKRQRSAFGGSAPVRDGS